MNRYDVIIVGGGPAGSACAALLARAGANVLVLDKSRFPRDKICGDCINPACWEYFELLGVSDEMSRRLLRTISKVRITNEKGKSLTLNVPAHPNRPFFAIRRSELDHLLLRCASRAGAHVIESRAVVGVAWNGAWNVRARTGEGDIENFSPARFLVGADGRNSVVARFLEKGKASTNSPGGKMNRNGDRLGVQWHAPYQPDTDSAVELYLFDSGYCGVVNIDEDRSNVAMVVRPSVLRQSSRDIPGLCCLTLGRNVAAKRRLEDLAPARGSATAFPINPMLHNSHHPAAYLAGDARQTVEPFTGEGVFFALQDGVRTAEKILHRLEKKSSDTPMTHRTAFFVNHIFSPALRSRRVSGSLLALGDRFPFLIPLASPTVFRQSLFSFFNYQLT